MSAADGTTIERPFLRAVGERPGRESAMLPWGEKLY
jgi:hypothetical protein